MEPQILKFGFFGAIFLLFSLGINAQLPNTPNPPTSAHWTVFTATGESVDSVTVGSRMPYRVAAQTAVAGLTFEYKWLFSSALTVQTLSGTTLTGSNNYYVNNEISVVMPAITGDITINANVRTLSGGSVLCAAPTDDTYTVRVIARPTINWAANGSVVGCSAQEVNIPLTTLNGYKQYEIAYSITFYNTFDKSGGVTSTSGGYVVLTGDNLNFPASAFNNGIGLYEIEVTGITDRISRKSLDMNLVKSTSSDLPGDAYKVYVYPTPTTNPLEHIKNMP